MKKTVLTVVALIFLVAFSYGQQYKRIQNRWKGTFLHIEKGNPDATAIGPGAHSAMWVIEREGGTIKIKNRWKDTYLILNQRGTLECVSLKGKTFMELLKITPRILWSQDPIPGTDYFRLKNNATNTYLHVENGRLEATMIGAGAHSAHWKFIPVN